MCYESKKRNAKERGIEFLLTKEEYDFFMLLREDRDVRCAYTNQPFILRQGHDQYPTLERWDDRKGYSLDNCLLVGKLANQIKDAYVDKRTPIKSSLKEHHANLARQLKHKCTQPDWLENCWKVQVGARLHLLKPPTQQKDSSINSAGKIIEQQEKIMSESTKATFYRNQDLELAAGYTQLGVALSGTSVEFVLSFSDYKTLMSKKTCQLTGVPFPENTVKSLYFKDKTKAISRENCLVTTRVVQEALDKMFVSVKLSTKQLQKLFKTLGD